MKQKYWMCIIEIDEQETPNGFDSVPRQGAVNAIEQEEGIEVKNCWSGWGMTDEIFDDIMREWNRDRSNEKQEG